MSFDLSQARSRRDHGTGTALDNAGDTWHERARELALSFFRAAGHDGALFEDVRAYANEVGLPAPPSPNAWGAVCLSLSRQDMIVKTGVYMSSKDVRSHARAQPVWRIK